MPDRLVTDTAMATMVLCGGDIHKAVTVSASALGRLIALMVADSDKTEMREATFTAIVALIRLNAGLDKNMTVFTDAIMVASQEEK